MKIEAQRLCRGSLRDEQEEVDLEKLEGGGTTTITKHDTNNDDNDNDVDYPPRRFEPWSELELVYPLASSRECRRFFQAYGERSPEHLQAYLDWRTMYDDVLFAYDKSKNKPSTHEWTRDKDRDAWEQAWEITWNQVEKLKVWNYEDHHVGEEPVCLFPPSITHKKFKPDSTKHHHSRNQVYYQRKYKAADEIFSFNRTQIPQYVFAHHTPPPPAAATSTTSSTTSSQDNAGAFIMLQVMPAQIDIKLANAEIHSLATSLYLLRLFRHYDRQCSDDNYATADMWLDVRGAPAWANPKPIQLLPLIRTMSHLLLALHPERLRRLIIFPLPKWAVAIYNVIQGILPEVVRERTLLVAGSDRHDVPPPMERMVACMLGSDKQGDDSEVEAAHATLSGMERVRHLAVSGAETRKGELRKAVKL